mmetsp:Transcript_132873/g.384159  ORF Transcript_132873/g.384159 Transcript_132873/m.384159 type:complete len:205 (-) Transcript_132873:138-752(-)
MTGRTQSKSKAVALIAASGLALEDHAEEGGETDKGKQELSGFLSDSDVFQYSTGTASSDISHSGFKEKSGLDSGVSKMEPIKEVVEPPQRTGRPPRPADNGAMMPPEAPRAASRGASAGRRTSDRKPKEKAMDGRSNSSRELDTSGITPTAEDVKAFSMPVKRRTPKPKTQASPTGGSSGGWGFFGTCSGGATMTAEVALDLDD